MTEIKILVQLQLLERDLSDDSLALQSLKSLVSHVRLLDGVHVLRPELDRLVMNGDFFSDGNPKKRLCRSGFHSPVCQLETETVNGVRAGDCFLFRVSDHHQVAVARFEPVVVSDLPHELVHPLNVGHS